MSEKVWAAAREQQQQRRGDGRRVSASSSSSSSGSQTLSEEGDAGGTNRRPTTLLPSGTAGRLGGSSFTRDEPLGRSSTPEQQVAAGAPTAALLPLRGKEERGQGADDSAGQQRRRQSEVSEDSASPGGGGGGGDRLQQFGPESGASLEEQDEELDSILSPPSMPFRKSSNPEVSSGPGKPLKFKRQLSEDGRPFRRGSLGGALTGRYLLSNAATQQSWQMGESSNLVRMRSQALGQSAPSLTASLEFYGRKYSTGPTVSQLYLSILLLLLGE